MEDICAIQKVDRSGKYMHLPVLLLGCMGVNTRNERLEAIFLKETVLKLPTEVTL